MAFACEQRMALVMRELPRLAVVGSLLPTVANKLAPAG